jgi:hypothetical protein
MTKCGSADAGVCQDIEGDLLSEVREELECKMCGSRKFISVCEIQTGALCHRCTISRDVQVASVVDAESIE